MRIALIMIATALAVTPAYPCLIFVLTKDNHVLVGNHEDWTARDARLRFIPATPDQLAVAVFDFESEGYIQGGVNEAGLFFDATATPFSPIDVSGKEKFEGKDLWLTLLQKCRTVQEAVAFVERYQVPELERVHLLFADKSGQSVILGSYEGRITYTWKSQPIQVLTNFNIVDPEYGGEQPCPRFATANTMLNNGANPIDVLRQTTQGQLTVYTTLVDLTSGTLQVGYLSDFSHMKTFSLRQEWPHPRQIVLSDLFR